MTDEVINPGQTEAFDFDSAPGGEAAVSEAENEVAAKEVPAAEAATAEQAQGDQQAPPQAEEQMFEYVYKGETVKIPKDRATNILQQAHVLDEKFKDYNSKESELERRMKDFQPTIEKYEKIDKWATENEEEFDQILAEVRKRQVLGGLPSEIDPNDPLVKANLQLRNEIDGLKSELSKFRQETEMSKQSEADLKAEQDLKKEITEVREQFKDVNFDAVNEHGFSVENQVIKYGLENGLSFRQAFLDYMHPTLLKLAEERGAKKATESVQQKHKLGIVSGGATAQRSPSTSVDTSRSWDEIGEEIKRDFGL